MKAPNDRTFSGSLVSDESAKRFRNQGTGIGQTRSASERTGAYRSQAVIDAAPAAQRACADRSYPAPMVGGMGWPVESAISSPDPLQRNEPGTFRR
jgi:hypothetical protein